MLFANRYLGAPDQVVNDKQLSQMQMLEWIVANVIKHKHHNSQKVFVVCTSNHRPRKASLLIHDSWVTPCTYHNPKLPREPKIKHYSVFHIPLTFLRLWILARHLTVVQRLQIAGWLSHRINQKHFIELQIVLHSLN